MTTEDFLGVSVEVTSLREAAADFLRRAKTNTRPEAYRLVNGYTFALASKTPAYLSLLRGPGINLPDGKPLAKVLDRTVGPEQTCEQVRGPSFFELCLDAGRGEGIRHFFLGASEETLDLLKRNVLERFPGVQIVGTHSPPFRPLGPDDFSHHDQLIRASNADVVWVGMGTPRQDYEARRITDSLGVSTAGVGAAFDFSAGVKRQAPRLMHRLGLEWLFRLASEPRRLGRRYIFGNAVFLRLVGQHWATRRRAARERSVSRV